MRRQPVPIRVYELALAASKTFLVNRDSELRGHGLDVDHIQVDGLAGGASPVCSDK